MTSNFFANIVRLHAFRYGSLLPLYCFFSTDNRLHWYLAFLSQIAILRNLLLDQDEIQVESMSSECHVGQEFPKFYQNCPSLVLFLEYHRRQIKCLSPLHIFKKHLGSFDLGDYHKTYVWVARESLLVSTICSFSELGLILNDSA